jgi:acetyltransferase
VERDVSVRVLPVDRAEIERMVDETRMSRLLGMGRGKPAGDRVALIDALIRLAGIASAMEDCLVEIDVNPIIVLPDRRGVKALDAN